MAKVYSVIHTKPTMFIDDASQPVEGFEVRVMLHEFGEGHIIHVPKLDAEVVGARVAELLDGRRKLAALGG